MIANSTLIDSLNRLIEELSEVPKTGVTISPDMAEDLVNVFTAMKEQKELELRAVGAR